mgnify:CR=1 FL=1
MTLLLCQRAKISAFNPTRFLVAAPFKVGVPAFNLRNAFVFALYPYEGNSFCS